jgi:hypothetical protein
VLCDKLGLEAVGEGHPREVAKDEHEPETFRRDVHRREDRGLEEEGVADVEQLKGVD